MVGYVLYSQTKFMVVICPKVEILVNEIRINRLMTIPFCRTTHHLPTASTHHILKCFETAHLFQSLIEPSTEDQTSKTARQLHASQALVELISKP